jgi:integrase
MSNTSAWVGQDPKQVKKHGEDVASWYVFWREPDGKQKCKSCGPGSFGKLQAEKLRRKREAELLSGTYKSQLENKWGDFREEYRSKILEGQRPATRLAADVSLDHFERIIKPVKVSHISTYNVDTFIEKRRQEKGKKQGDTLSPASLNKDLRHIKKALRVARKWGYLQLLPEFAMQQVPKKLIRYVTDAHFAAVYRSCDVAKSPRGLPYSAADWWRGLLMMGYMTGWRIGDLLGLHRDDLDLEEGWAITRAASNKGKRDDRVKLHPVVVEHLTRLKGFDPRVFPWNRDRKPLHDEFARIQEAAGIHLPCQEKHQHTRFCHVYGFHDLRRAFATMNADKLTPDALQALMRHKSYQTTQVYINMTRQMDAAVASLHVPEVLKAAHA